MNKDFDASPNELSNGANNGDNSRSNHDQTQGLSDSSNHHSQNQGQDSNPIANHNQSTSGHPNLEWGDRCVDPTGNDSSYASCKLNGAIANLIDRVSNFSDSHFDTLWMSLDEAELIELVSLVIVRTTEHLSGQLLGGLLLHLREQREAVSLEPDSMPEAEGQQAQPNSFGD